MRLLDIHRCSVLVLKNDTYVLLETLLVKIRRALNFAKVVAGALSVLINLEWSLTRFWHLSVHKRGSVLLELSSLRFNLKFIITEESSRVLAINTGLCVNIGSSLSGTGVRSDFEASLRFFASEEDCLIGLEGRALGSHFNVLTEKDGVVALESLALHIGWDNTILHALELVTDSVSWVSLLALNSIVEELAGVHLVLRCSVADLVLEELLLRLFEFWVTANVLGDGGHSIGLALLAARLLELGVVQFVHLNIVLTTVEFGIRLHHRLLLVLWKIVESASGPLIATCSDAHLLSAGLGES